MLQRRELELVNKKWWIILELKYCYLKLYWRLLISDSKRQLLLFNHSRPRPLCRSFFLLFFYFWASNHFVYHFHLTTTIFFFLSSTMALTYVFSSTALVSKDKIFRQMISPEAQLCSENFVWSICFIFFSSYIGI